MKTIKLPESFLFEGGERAVILLHAYTGSPNDVRLLGRELERAGYTAYSPIFTGHASIRFEDILDKGSPDQWLKDAQDAVQFLRRMGYEEIAIMGLSLGGLVATRMLEIDDFIGGGSFNSSIYQVGNSNIPGAFVNYYRSFNKRLEMDPTELEEGVVRIKQKLQGQLAEIKEFSGLVQQDIGKVTTPYYLASAGQDELIDKDNGRVLRDALVNADVDYQFFPDAKHVITVGSKRQQFEESVLAFLDQLDWKEGK